MNFRSRVLSGAIAVLLSAGCGGDDSTGNDEAAGDASGDAGTSAVDHTSPQPTESSADTGSANMPDASSTSPDTGGDESKQPEASGDAPDGAEARSDAPGEATSPADAVADVRADIIDATQDTADAPAGPTHLIFVTSADYDGDLVGAANALVADGGVSAPDGGTFGSKQGIAAANAICQMHAKRAGLPGTYGAIIQDSSGDGFSKLTDSDGPWALANGTPVASTVADLRAGRLRATVDLTEAKSVLTSGYAAWGWEQVGFGDDCGGWSYHLATVDGGADSRGTIGAFANVGADWLFYGHETCDNRHPIYCAQIGAGGGPLVFPAAPGGSKIVFASIGPLRGDFVATSGVDAGTDGGTDSVHRAADAACAAAASAGQRTGTFRAWISSSTEGAVDYFARLGMNGPWYRPDGLLVAGDRATLTAASGIADQIVLDAAGAFVSMRLDIWTGSNAAGHVTNNCNDFQSSDGALYGTGANITYKNQLQWGSGYGATCNTANLGLYCFEQ